MGDGIRYVSIPSCSRSEYEIIPGDDGTPTSDENGWTKAKGWAKKQAKSTCSTATLKKRLPIIGWLQTYNMTAFQCDLIAGLTVGLTVIPQGIAYAAVAGLHLQFGLYTAFMGCFVYCVLGSTREVNIGPTAIIALLTAQQSKIGGEDYAILLGFLSGVIILLFSIFNLGFLIDFISVPVISGFSSAAALIIVATQLGGLLGLKPDADNFFLVIYELCKNITYTKIPDLIMGVTCLIILFTLRKLNSIKWDSNDAENPPSTCKLALRKAFWLVCTGRNALVVIIAAVITYTMSVYGISWFSPSGNVKPGLPHFSPPPFSVERNGTTIEFLEICKDLGGSIVLIPLVSILEHMAIAKVFARGKSVDAKQELLSLGVANVLGSFVSAFPSTGSFSRTALNGSCGIKSPIGGLYTGTLVLLALGFLAPTFRFIPKASLSAVIISAVVFMIEYEMVVHLWRTKKMELFIMLVTFSSCLALSAEYGILIGIGLSLLVLLYTSARPRIQIERTSTQQVEFIRIQPDQNLFFPAIEYLRFRIGKATNCSETIPVVFDGSHISATDYTIAQGIKQIFDDFKSRNQKIFFTNLKKEVIDLLHRMEAHDISNLSTDDELESILQAEPTTKLQVTVINNSSWQPEVDLTFGSQTPEIIETKLNSDLDDVKIWPPLANGIASLPDKDLNGSHTPVTNGIGDGDVRAGLLSNDQEDANSNGVNSIRSRGPRSNDEVTESTKI